MNGINIRGTDSMGSLQAIAKMAYGSGMLEKTSGGAGNIGLLNGHVVKFNTHLGERMGSTTTDNMRESCDNLRRYLGAIAADLLLAPSESKEAVDKKSEVYASICKDLGLKMDGKTIEAKGLLDRTVVAKVLNKFNLAMGVDVFNGLKEMKTQLSSSGINTQFSNVYNIAYNDKYSAIMVDDALAELAKPAEGRTSFKLTSQEKVFMTKLVQRERAALFAAGKPVPSAEEFKQSVLKGQSTAFAATMLTFGHTSKTLDGFCKLTGKNNLLAGYFSGAPEKERLDRAELFMTACNSLNDVSKTISGSASILRMCEKLKEMRDLQPEGRLTCETIWKACFNEELPKELRKQEGTATFADALDRRTDELARKMLEDIIPDLKKNKGQCETFLGFTKFAVNLMASFPNLKALIMTGLKITHDNKFSPLVPDLKYRFNPSTESLGCSSLYPKDNAIHHTTETIRDLMVKDFPRRPMVVRLDNGPDKPPTEIDLRNFKDINVAEHPARVTEFMNKIDAYLGDVPPVQRNVVMFAFTQAGIAPLPGFLGTMADAKSDMVITLSKDPKDASRMMVSFESAKTMAMDIRYAYSVDPDGTNLQHGERISQPRVN